MIRIKNLSKTFDKSCNVDALKNVNLSIEAGDVCGVIGMSGAGKSTLLRCIAMLETPSSGSIEIDGRDIFSLKGKELLDLKKKLKGKYEKDTETLMKLVGLPEQEASDWAYLTAEIINWEWMLQILKSAEWKGTPQEAVEIIRAAIIVDEGIKVTVEAEKTE